MDTPYNASHIAVAKIDLDALTFDDLTDIALAVEKGRTSPDRELERLGSGDLGPFVELALRLEHWNLRMVELPSFARAPMALCFKRARSASSPAFDARPGETLGFLKLEATSGQEPDTFFTQWGIRAKRAAIAAGVPDLAAGSLIGAVKELRDNVVEHSRRPRSGIVAFAATPTRFEFCVADGGKGVLASLRENPQYDSLTNSGQALRVALTDGESRFGRGLARGYGFHDLFRGLQKIQGVLHFKSGDHRLEHRGLSPVLRELDLAQCADLRGFLVSATCMTAGG